MRVNWALAILAGMTVGHGIIGLVWGGIDNLASAVFQLLVAILAATTAICWQIRQIPETPLKRLALEITSGIAAPEEKSEANDG